MQRWTCSKCGWQITIPSVTLPVRCKCGYRDDGGESIVSLEGHVEVPKRSLVKTYYSALQRWIDAGRPSRTDKQVDSILRDHCSHCPLFADSRCTHQKCGCQIRSAAGEREQFLSWILPGAMLNKLRMGTEKCPDGRWS